ncbi:MAG: septum formation initiator family protein [Culturomica sp.]|jgi:cell division protein FtsB|nr:septum formation initiator family protein [Culturomica sp.]
MPEISVHHWKKIARRFSNKYLLAGAFFLLWITFIDENSLVNQMQLRHKIATLTRQKEYYREKTEEDKRKISELLGNRDSLEKFAREQYLMKKRNEDIYIIVEE